MSLVSSRPDILSSRADNIAVWLRLADTADATTGTDDVKAAISALPDITLGGSALQQAEQDYILGMLLEVATGLLAVSVLIAIVGIANTLSLSTLERTGESALLRALGLTQAQLRAMLGAEAVLLAAVGAVLGTVMGVGYGWAGAHYLIDADTPIVLTVGKDT